MHCIRKNLHVCCALAFMAIAPCAFAENEVVPGNSYPTTDQVTVSQLQTDKNGAYFTVSLFSNTDIIYCAYNMVISLPPGISFATVVGNGNPMVKMTDTSFYPTDWEDKFYHSISSKIVDGKLRLACVSFTNAEFKKGGGDLFDVYVDISPWAKAGANDVTISETKFVTKTEVGYIPTIGVVGSFDVSGTSRELPVSITAANKVGTCILPFPYMPVGFEAYEVDHADATTLYLQKVEQMEAYKPYILLAEEGYEQILVGDASEADFPGSAVVETNGLCGVIQTTLVSEGYVLQNKGDGPVFYRIGTTPFSLKGGKCYLAPVSSGISLAPKFSDDKSGISDVDTDADADIYGLDGRLVERPVPGQLYIQNGKKIIKL